MIDVSCAIIIDSQNRILVAQRSATMPLPNKWEFPGGKVEQGETAKQSLIREIKEELDLSIIVVRRIASNSHSYGQKEINLIPFICKISGGEISLKEHQAYKWLKSNELLDLDWAEADVPIVRDLLSTYDDI